MNRALLGASRSLPADFARFLVSGSLATAAHWSVLWLGVTVLGFEGTVSTSLGFLLGATVSYLLNYYWTFRSDASHLQAMPRFLAVAVTGLLLNAGIFAAVYYGLTVHHFLAQAVATGTVLFWNFSLHRAWSFRGNRLDAPPAGPWIPAHASRAALVGAAAFIVLLGASTGFQLLRGAYASSFGTDPDETAHYVTGLMVREYVAHGVPRHPLRFAEDFYVRYPRVALGQWPPGFYALQAVWTLPFGAGRASVVTLMATLAAALGLLVFLAARQHGVFASAAAALLLVTLPLVQIYSGAIMTEVFLALLCFGAVLAFGAFVDGGKDRHVLLFGVLAVAAILTKGDGLALALVPITTLLLTGRWRLLRRPALYITGAAVGLLTAPWYVLTSGRVSETWAGTTSESALGYALRAIPTYVNVILGMGGVVVAALAVVGLVVAFNTRRAVGISAAAVGLVVGALLVHGFIPSGMAQRHMIMVAPALMWFFAIGLAAFLVRLRQLHRVGPFAVAAVLLVVGIHQVLTTPPKSWSGFAEVAQEIARDPAMDGRALLVSSDTIGDGIIIAEVAMHDEQRSRIVLRANRIISSSGWLGDGYQLHYAAPSSILRLLDAVPVALVVIDTTVPERDRRPHHDLLRETMLAAPEPWRLITARDVRRNGTLHAAGLEIYGRSGPTAPAVVRFEHVYGNPPVPLLPREGL